MFTQALQASDQSLNSIFFDKPRTIQINEEARTKYPASEKIEFLIAELNESGPFIALGQMGPQSYSEEPFLLKDKFHGKDIYGWKPDAARIKASKSSSLLILGAKKNGEREHVYFTLSKDVTMNLTSPVREHKPSHTDSNIYVVSYKTFQNYLSDLYPSTASSVTKEQQYAQMLSKLPLDSILDRGAGRARCKAIGQQVFDEFKLNANGNSFAGKEAAQKVCELTASFADNGLLRKQFIERAWDGIGDDNWRWMA